MRSLDYARDDKVDEILTTPLHYAQDDIMAKDDMHNTIQSRSPKPA